MNNIGFILLVVVFTCVFLYLFHLVKKGFKNPEASEENDNTKEEKKTKPSLKKKK